MDLVKIRKRKLIIFFSVCVFCWVFFLIYRYIRVGIQGAPYPCADFRFDPEDRFKDFFTINNAVADLNPYISKLSNYPPIILIFAYIFARTGDYSVYDSKTLYLAIKDPELLKTFYWFIGMYIVAFAFVCFFYAFINNKADPKRPFKEKIKQFALAGLIGTALMLSAPSIFLIDRGNYLAVTVVLIMLWAILEEEKPQSIWGAVFAALCAATKVYPIYLLLIYLIEKKFRKFFTAIIVGATVTLIPVFAFRGSYIENVKEFILGVMGFGGGTGIYSVYYTVGITGQIGYIFRLFGMLPSGRVIKIVWFGAGVILTLIGLGLLKSEKKTWKKLLVLTALMVYLTPNSFLYNTTYLFGPIFIMLMSKDKPARRDIPYVVLSALLLVPKAYFHLHDIPGIVPLEFNSVNSGVLFDTFGYLALILYYFAERLIVIRQEDIARVGNGAICRKPCLTRGKKLALYGIVACSIASILFLVFWGVRDTILACHDSLMEFVYARVNGWESGYSDAFRYGLARGRVGFIFPAVVAFRYLVLAKGSYLALWALQYIPVFLNIGLIGLLIGKKVNKICGMMFPIVFTGLLQIDIWHSLITCYPLDFMYGLFITILGVWLYSDFLDRRGSKYNLIRFILSLILFYESLQVYEAFIVSALIYAILSFADIRKNKTGIKGFIKNLIPHFAVSVIYLGIMAYLRSHPVVDIAVSDISSPSSFGNFVKPYLVYTFGMFPTVDIRIISAFKETLAHLGKRAMLSPFVAFFAAFAGSWLIMETYRHYGKEKRQKTGRRLVILLCSGIAPALTFAIPHSLISSYQDWVIRGHAGGYVPTTICYFGWSVAICSVLYMILHFIAYRPTYIRAVGALIISGVFAGGVLITFAINSTFRVIESSTGTWTSLKAQTFYSLVTDDTVKELGPQVIYSPSYNGIHNDIGLNDSLADEELGYDTALINDIDELYSITESADDVEYFLYDPDANVGLLIEPQDITGRERSWRTDQPIYIVTPMSGQIQITYFYPGGGRSKITVDVSSDHGTYVDIPGTILTGSIDVERIA